MAAFGLNVTITDDDGEVGTMTATVEAVSVSDAKEQLETSLLEEGKYGNVDVDDCFAMRELIESGSFC